MKKKLGFILAVVCAAFLVCSAIAPAHQDSVGRDVFQVIQKYRSYKGVEAINIGPFIMKLARLTGTEEAKWVNRVAILSVEESDAQVTRQIMCLHNGTIVLERSDDRMTTFVMEFK